MSREEPQDEQGAIAIIGMAARMPGAPDLDAFWHNLRHGVESISIFAEHELLESGMDLTTIHQPNFVPAKAVLADVDQFDASFFGISPREAELMDPQHRLLMECAWEVLEHAGYDSEAYGGRIAVYTSAGMNTYLPLNVLSNPGLAERVGGFQLSIYNDKDFVPTRIAYSMNLKGPGVDIGTACSSSLVSLHFACQNLITYQCDMALVGAVSVHFPLKVGHVYEAGTAYSPDSHCRPFDATPSGLIDGNGLGAVVLKRLGDALADGDSIYAVIKGTAINNDGSMKVGYAAPSVEGQARVIVEAQAMAGCHPDTITYVEAHGTATPLGDPIEVAALTQAFRTGTNKTRFCGIGSVKSNIGHVDKAAGLAGLIKTSLALKHGMIPPSLHFTAPNPKLNLPDSPFYVVDALQEWPANGKTPRRAGISSFGVGGTNAHAVIEEAPPVAPGSPSRPVQLLMVSAKTEAALQAATGNLISFLGRQPDINLADVCYTLQRGRRPFVWRRAVACSSIADAVTALGTPRQAGPTDRADHNVVFMFPGQGSQYPGMGRDLYLHEPTFREQIDQCAGHLGSLLGLDIRELLFPAEGDYETAAARLEQTELTQPALFTIEYALARLWISWGLRPRAMIGHSLGEYVAACVAGVFSLPDALTLIAARGRMMQQLPPGAMVAVPLSEQELLPLLGRQIDLAAVNGPNLCVISGPETAVADLREQLARQGLTCPRLHTSHAFHSAMMAPMVAPFTELVRRIELKPPQIPYLSNLTGTWITQAEATQPEYWAEQLRRPVRFAAGLACLLDFDTPLLLEVGPGRTLSSLATRNKGDQRQLCFASLPQAREKRGAQHFLLHTLADLWMAGAGIDWTGYYQHERRLRLALPTYPFQRRRYWIEPGKRPAARGSATVRKPEVADWFYLPSWKATVTPALRQKTDPETTSCLLFSDEYGVAEALEKELELLGHTMVRVRTGAGFARHDARTYVLDPAQPADFTALCDDLLQRDALPCRIVYLWGITGEHTAGGDPREVGLYCDGVLSLVRALGWLLLSQPIEILVIANQMRDVGGETSVDPAKAALLGPLSTISWEYPNLTGRAIDIPSPGSPNWRPRNLAIRLVREFGAPAADRIVALRAGHRWVADLDPVHLETETVSPPAAGLIRHGGVYIITGGLTDIGLRFARQIAETAQGRLSPPKLVLTTTGSSAEHGPLSLSAVIAPVAQQLRELEALGCEVLPIHLEVFDTQHLESAFGQAESRFSCITGVIHAAAMSSPRPVSLIRDLDTAALDRYWQQQQQTVTALEECLRRREVDFCVLMSSLASEVGGMAQVAHTTASLYLDAFAHRHNQNEKYPWIIVNWDVWKVEEEWAETNSALAKIAMTPSEGAQAFQRILDAGEFERILVSSTDPRFRQQAIRETPQPEQTANGATDPIGSHQRPDLPTLYEPPRNDDEAAVAKLWQDVLGIDKIGIHDNFFDLGGHSLLATQLVSRLQQNFQVSVELDIFFSAPTIAVLTDVLLQKQLGRDAEDEITQLLEKLEEMTEEEAEALLASNNPPSELLTGLVSKAPHDRSKLVAKATPNAS